MDLALDADATVAHPTGTDARTLASTEPRSTRMPRERERALVRRARHEAGAFAELYDFYLPRIYGFIQRRVQERSVAEDLTATTFQRALEAVRGERFRNDAFGGWLYRVAGNAVIDHVRAHRRVLSIDDGESGSGFARVPVDDPAVDAFARALDRDELRAALRALPEQHRQVLVLRFFDDLDLEELCDVLGCSRKTFAVKLHRALAALRGAMLSVRAEATDAA